MADSLLTSQQIEIVKLIAEDYSRKEVAAKLSIGSKTVDKHIQAIQERLGVRGVAGITKFAIQHQLTK